MKQLRSVRPSQTKGFSLVEALLIVIVIAGLGLGGWYVYHHGHKTNPKTTSRTNSQRGGTTTKSGSSATGTRLLATVSSTDGKVSVELPSTWKVDSQYLRGGSAVISPGTNQACLNLNDPSPCAYQASFLPAVITDGTYGSISSGQNPTSNDSWSL